MKTVFVKYKVWVTLLESFNTEVSQRYAKEFAKAELEKLKEEIEKHVERTVDDTECDQWDGGFKVCAIDAKIIIDKRIGEL